MKTLALYFLQIMACSGLLYGYYHFFLRNNRFHQYNRYCLLMATLISLAVPFLKIPVYFSYNSDSAVQRALLDYNYYMMPEVVVTSSAQSGPFAWQQILTVLYAGVAFFLISRIVAAIAGLLNLKFKNPCEKWNRVLFIQTSNASAPFSFFNWIFWNRNINVVSDEGQKIMKHELYHVDQKHSFDIIFIEMVSAVLWFNPFYHLFKKELKAIHEFLADKYAAGETETSEYAEMLVLQAIGISKQSLVNPFFNNQLKRRINMLTSNKRPGSQYLRKLMVLPLLALVAMLFVISCKSSDDKTEKVVPDSVVVADAPPLINDSDSATVINVPPVKPPEEGPEIFTKVDIDAAYPGGPSAWRAFLERNLRGEVPVDNGAGSGNYTVILQFIVDRNGNVSDIKPLTRHGYGMEEEAIRVIKMSGKWKPAIQDGKEVKAYRKQPVTFQVLEQ